VSRSAISARPAFVSKPPTGTRAIALSAFMAALNATFS
jgi:hypothetical protein